MRVLIATVLTVIMTVTQSLAAGGGGDKVELSFMTVLFMGFGALIIVFQLVPAIILLGGMVRGLLTSPGKESKKEA